MFKKTLIAAAVATVASTAAMAGDSSVSGQVKYTLADTDGAATDWAASFDNSITFKSTEDLGNGLTAFAQITIDTDVDTDTTATADTAVASTGAIEKDAKLGVKGAFGTIVAGRMEYLIQGAFSSKMDDGGGNSNLESNLTDLGRAVIKKKRKYQIEVKKNEVVSNQDYRWFICFFICSVNCIWSS
jgi:predicted porin